MKRNIYIQDETNDYIDICSPLDWLMKISDLWNDVIRYQSKFCFDLTDEEMETWKDIDRIHEKLDDAYTEIEAFVSKKFVKGMNGKHYNTR